MPWPWWSCGAGLSARFPSRWSPRRARPRTPPAAARYTRSRSAGRGRPAGGGGLRAWGGPAAPRGAGDASGGGEVHALAIGGAGTSGVVGELGRVGADRIAVVEHPGLERYRDRKSTRLKSSHI